MMVQALLLLPRLLVVTPPARPVVVPPHRAATRQFSVPGVRLGEDGGRTARGRAVLLQAAISNVQASGGLRAAMQEHGHALEHASAELHEEDHKVVLAAVQENGFALEHAPAELQADREVVLAAVQQDERALCCASAELQEDDAVLQASNHMFADLDRLAERGQLKVLRTLARVRECGRQMNNCLAEYNLDEYAAWTSARKDRRGRWRSTSAVSSFANGEWEESRCA